MGIAVHQERRLIRESIEHEFRCMDEPAGSQKATIEHMGKGDLGVDVAFDEEGRCYNSPTMYHKPGAIHFINDAHSEFVRACRYCKANFSYTIIRNGLGHPVVSRVRNAQSE